MFVCQRHRRWLGPTDETSQYDLSAAKDILTAARRHAQLLAHSDDHEWASRVFHAAWCMAQEWTRCDPRHMPVFSQRWRDRAAALGITKLGKSPPRVVTFPEAVTLATILTDLDWRRHVALDWDVQPFYRHVAESIGEQSYSRWSIPSDPLSRWLRFHRHRFADVRKWAWRDPVPENRHFK